MPETLFKRYIGIDYSGAATPDKPLKGLRVYMAQSNSVAYEVLPPTGSSSYWSRREIASWLIEEMKLHTPTLVGIDHGFSFPLRYFEELGVAKDWSAFLDDFQLHWPTDRRTYSVEGVRRGEYGNASLRLGRSVWRRIAEKRAQAKSVFHFDVPGSVAKSTHAGLPWLRHLRLSCHRSVHFWPFDGWVSQPGCSVVAEVYPSLCNRLYSQEHRTPDQQDAFAIASWMRDTDISQNMVKYLDPDLSMSQKAVALVEGWILGVL